MEYMQRFLIIYFFVCKPRIIPYDLLFPLYAMWGSYGTRSRRRVKHSTAARFHLGWRLSSSGIAATPEINRGS